MKKGLIMLMGVLAIVMISSSSIAKKETFASNKLTMDKANLISESGLVSIETIPNEEAEANLPSALKAALHDDGFKGIDMPFIGVNDVHEPSSDHKWNLNRSGRYTFSVGTHNSIIYSNYVFTGHGGSVKVHLDETTNSTHPYTFTLYRCALFGTVLYTYKFDHGLPQTFKMNNFNSSDKIYFSITPFGHTRLSNRSYIEKY